MWNLNRRIKNHQDIMMMSMSIAPELFESIPNDKLLKMWNDPDYNLEWE